MDKASDKTVAGLVLEGDLSSFKNLAVDEKLCVLSQFQQWLEKPKSSEANGIGQYLSCKNRHLCWMELLKYCIQSEQDKYVVFTARKLITKTVGTFAIQEDFVLLKHLLSSRSDHFQLTGLQICRDLFSSSNTQSKSMVLELGSSVLDLWEILQNCSETGLFIQCLFEMFTIFIKVCKGVCVAKDNEIHLTFLQSVLKCPDRLMKFLFADNMKKYVKQKMLKFLCLILKSSNMTLFNRIRTEILTLTSVLYKVIEYKGFSLNLGPERYSTFTGKHVQKVDNVHTLDKDSGLWILLYLYTSGLLIHREEFTDKIITILTKLDEDVKHILNRRCSAKFPWLPDVYGDQDDMWIDAMDILVDIFTIERLCDAPRNQPHVHYLQFVQMLGYDHTVLLDLLTSPETNFLSYFVKYVKHLLKTWEDFLGITRNFFSLVGQTRDALVDAKEDVTNELSANITYRNTLCNPEQTSSEDDSNFKKVVSHKSTTKNQEIQFVSFEGGTKCSNKKTDFRENLKTSHFPSVIAQSLSQIADAYGSDDDSLDENDDAPDKDDCAPEKYNDDAPDEDVDASDKDDGVPNKEHVAPVKDDDDDEEDDTMDDSELSNLNPSESDDNHLEINIRDTHSDISHCCSNTWYEGRVCLAHGQGESVEPMLDSVMGMIIRTKLKMEKLWSRGLMQYDPSLLLDLLSQVEDLYESSPH